MKARVTKTFRWSPDGNVVQTFTPGTVLEGRAAAKAIRAGLAEPVADGPKPPAPMNESVEAAPKNRALWPPKNRGQR